MKKMILLLGVIGSQIALAQVGINTEAPKATLDVASKPNDNTKVDGFIAPRLTGDELKAKDALYVAAQTGAIVYATAAANPTTAKTVNVTDPGYYYFDGTVWVKISDSNSQALAGTEWYKSGTTTDAASDKIEGIWRSGFIGIGANLGSTNMAPGAPIHVISNNGNAASDNLTYVSYNNPPSIRFYGIASRGTLDTPEYLMDNDAILGVMGSAKIPAPSNNFFGGLEVRANGNHSATSAPTKLLFYTTPVNSLASGTKMTIIENGFTGINTLTPISRLDVRGAIRGGIPHADEISGVSAIGLNSIAVGQNNMASGNNTAIIGGSGNTNSATSAVILGSTNTAIASTAGNAAILSSNTSQINGTSQQAVILGGANNNIANSPYSIILSGSQNLIDATTGRSIVLSGTKNIITGGANGSVAGGTESVSSGFSSFAFGQKTTASGYASLAFGNETKSTAISSFAIGYQSTASGNYSFVTGRGTTAGTYAETVIGMNNEITTGDAASWQLADPTFQIGIGASPSAPKNAVTVYKNGKVQLNQLKGTGNAYACIDTNGNLFRSAVPCPVAVAP